MENRVGGGPLRLAEVFVSIEDPRQRSKVRHDLVELLVVAVTGVLAGAGTFAEIELWAREKLDWLRRHLPLEHGIPSHDTFAPRGVVGGVKMQWMQRVSEEGPAKFPHSLGLRQIRQSKGFIGKPRLIHPEPPHGQERNTGVLRRAQDDESFGWIQQLWFCSRGLLKNCNRLNERRNRG